MGRTDWLAAEHVAGQRRQPATLPRLDGTEVSLAGRLPNAILRHLLETGCLERGDQRSLIVTRSGRVWFDKLGVDARGRSPVERRASALLVSGA